MQHGSQEVGFFQEKGILGEAVEATRGSWVVLYVQYAVAPCRVFTVVKIIISHGLVTEGDNHYQKVVWDAP